MHNRIGILGLGNLLLSDEGFGVHFINYLNDHFQIPDQVSVLDGGTAGIMLAPFIEDVDILYVIDTVALKDEPGSIHRFTDDDFRAGTVQVRMSPHQVGLLDILALCKLRETAPNEIEMITVVPESLETSINLTARLESRLPEVLEILRQSLAERDVHLQAKEQPAGA